MLTIEARATGRRRALLPSWGIPLPPEWGDGDGLTLRDVIVRIVAEEVEAFKQRQAEARFLRVLTEADLAAGEASGRIVSGGNNLRQPTDPDAAVAVALQAFEDGLYLVAIDGVQTERLSEPVKIGADSTVIFIRLVALSGG